ncbi:hypothetical protein [Kaistella palustris]|uniref:hypothetical protein n=1 Tax=Kaistella palustris TaxID=493376 RepID=UPI00041FAFB4|nr:hypothetical protein [Kaistella palustris]
MKNFTLIFILIFLSATIFAQKNKVEINGWTNVNTFKCVNANFVTSVPVSVKSRDLPNIALKVTDFDCRNRMMTADFRKTLNAENHPVLTVKFLSISPTKFNKITALVEVKMMNVAHKYMVEFSEDNGSLVGNKRLKFSDFNIEPPKRMGGMVYVKNELDLLFSLAIQN